MQLTFHGAAGTVTGSKYLLTVNGSRLLIDCGMFQGPRELRQRNWAPAPFDVNEIDAVVITHAHIDHVGYLPRVVKLGYRNPVYGTPPTLDIARISLEDTAEIQEEDAHYRTKKKLSRHGVALPLFTVDDAKDTMTLFREQPFHVWERLNDNFRIRLHVAGHLLGASSVEVEVTEGDRRVRILFSGDVGRYGNPLTVNPGEPPDVDYLVCESTYGGRIHPPEDPFFGFAELINEVIREKRVLLIPAFAIGRTQQITHLVNRLIVRKMIPPIDVHIDSPMAISATDIYCKYSGYHSLDARRLGGPECELNSGYVQLHRKRQSSKMLNKLKGPAIIISSSGMMTAGRILHHLLNRLDKPETVLAIVGYMAHGTLGRRIVEGEKTVYIHKHPIDVKAKVVELHGLSGHADYYELLHWLEPIGRKPERVFVTHGEESQAAAWAEHLREERGWACHAPVLDETVEL